MGKKQRETIRAIKNRARRGRRYTDPNNIRTTDGVPKSPHSRYWQNMMVGAADAGERRAYSAHRNSQKGGAGQQMRAWKRRQSRVKPGSGRARRFQ
ncbi:MAG: hypothetical protein CL489_03375 [Acidobacteria bacterium]|nr:hypothetical protein [Acidobacteriota bacterium]